MSRHYRSYFRLLVKRISAWLPWLDLSTAYACEIIYILSLGCVMILEDPAIAIMQILVPGNGQKHCAPYYVFFQTRPRRNRGKTSRGLLLILKILYPFLINSRHVQIQH